MQRCKETSLCEETSNDALGNIGLRLHGVLAHDILQRLIKELTADDLLRLVEGVLQHKVSVQLVDPASRSWQGHVQALGAVNIDCLKFDYSRNRSPKRGHSEQGQSGPSSIRWRHNWVMGCPSV